MLEHTRNIVRLLILRERSLLLAKVIKKRFFFLPGGGIEYNEPVQRAAKRELLEELGILPEAVALVKPIGVYEHSWDDNGSPFHELNIICKCTIDGLNPDKEVHSSEEHLAFEWVELSQLGLIDLRPGAFMTLIPEWIAQETTGNNFFASSMVDLV